MIRLLQCILFISLSVLNCFPQGKVQRPTKQVNPSNKPVHTVKNGEVDGYINGHAYIDLGLPSGTKWATCNVGADEPSECGNYFAWGETSTKSSYTKDNSLTYRIHERTLKSHGIVDERGILNKKNDAASVIWGSSWRMPTREECEELQSKCKWIIISKDGIKCLKITGPNGNSIYLPASGYREGDSLSGVSAGTGCYWSASVREGRLESYDFSIAGSLYAGYGYRYYGFTIRPVSE